MGPTEGTEGARAEGPRDPTEAPERATHRGPEGNEGEGGRRKAGERGPLGVRIQNREIITDARCPRHAVTAKLPGAAAAQPRSEHSAVRSHTSSPLNPHNTSGTKHFLSSGTFVYTVLSTSIHAESSFCI